MNPSLPAERVGCLASRDDYGLRRFIAIAIDRERHRELFPAYR